MDVGITAYGVYVPRFRIKTEEIARVWGKDGNAIKASLMVNEKSVPDLDEDTITISVEAARNALKMQGNKINIGAIYVGSESHPYAVYPTASTLAEAIGVAPEVTAADLEFACKAGTAGMQMLLGMVKGGLIEHGIAIGADCAQGRPGDALEFTAGAGAVAVIIGTDGVIAKIEDTYSFTTDTPDFWRRDGVDYPSHGGRFTGQPAYFRHIIGAAKGLLAKLNRTVDDYDYAIFHQPNARFPLSAAKALKIPKEKVEPSLAVKHIGNTYSGSSMMGLASVLDIAKPGDKILMVSFGSGAGSDAFSIEVTGEIENKRGRAPTVQEMINRKKYIDYAAYVKHRGKIKM